MEVLAGTFTTNKVDTNEVVVERSPEGSVIRSSLPPRRPWETSRKLLGSPKEAVRSSFFSVMSNFDRSCLLGSRSSLDWSGLLGCRSSHTRSSLGNG